MERLVYAEKMIIGKEELKFNFSQSFSNHTVSPKLSTERLPILASDYLMYLDQGKPNYRGARNIMSRSITKHLRDNNIDDAIIIFGRSNLNSKGVQATAYNQVMTKYKGKVIKTYTHNSDMAPRDDVPWLVVLQNLTEVLQDTQEVEPDLFSELDTTIALTVSNKTKDTLDAIIDLYGGTIQEHINSAIEYYDAIINIQQEEV